jgi:hypothetical protein
MCNSAAMGNSTIMNLQDLLTELPSLPSLQDDFAYLIGPTSSYQYRRSSSFNLAPQDDKALRTFAQALGAAEDPFSNTCSDNDSSQIMNDLALHTPLFSSSRTLEVPASTRTPRNNKVSAALSAANRLAFAEPNNRCPSTAAREDSIPHDTFVESKRNHRTTTVI